MYSVRIFYRLSQKRQPTLCSVLFYVLAVIALIVSVVLAVALVILVLLLGLALIGLFILLVLHNYPPYRPILWRCN